MRLARRSWRPRRGRGGRGRTEESRREVRDAVRLFGPFGAVNAFGASQPPSCLKPDLLGRFATLSAICEVYRFWHQESLKDQDPRTGLIVTAVLEYGHPRRSAGPRAE